MVIFGAGADLNRMLKNCNIINYIECIVDSDMKKAGSVVNGIPVRSIDFLEQMRFGETVYISSKKYYDEICQTIQSKAQYLKMVYLGDVLVDKQEEHERKIWYRCADTERNLYLKYKEDYTIKNETFIKRYFRLMKNLDEHSAKTVNVILDRLQLLYSTTNKQLDIFTESEQLQLTECKKILDKEIFRVGDDIYAYGNSYLPKKFFNLGIWFYKYGLDFVENKAFVRQGDIIDCGAYIGDSTLLFSHYTDKRVYALEAQKENCNLIERTISLNEAENIRILNVAVADEKRKGYIYHHDNANWGTMNPYSVRDYSGKEEISVDTIDHIVEENQIHCSLIKADIEVSEGAMLRGAVQTLKKYRPVLLICLHHTAEDFWGIKPFIEDLNLGYQFKIFKKTDGNILTGTYLIAECR